jgi:5-carboxymethyl-2-hydroxymuconate isomerase
MPHLVILYTRNLDAETDMGQLCRGLADVMLATRDENNKPVFPPGGVRVLAYPAAHSAVADGKHDYAFVYLNLRMGKGRSPDVMKKAGDSLVANTKAHFAPLVERRYIGVTLQIDEGREVFDAKHSSIHPLFKGS